MLDSNNSILNCITILKQLWLNFDLNCLAIEVMYYECYDNNEYIGL